MTAKPNRIDVHHHFVPAEFVAHLARTTPHWTGGPPIPNWNLDIGRETMERNGIATAIASPVPHVHWGDLAAAQHWARYLNEFAARAIHDDPMHFGGLATLPLPDTQAACRELEYALDELKLDGVIVFSNSRGIYLGDARFAPLFEELERRRAVVFIHPNMSPDPTAHKLGLPDALIDFVADTTRAVAQMHYSNRFALTPNVKYIIAHAGGTIPYLAGRFRIVDEMKVMPGGEARGTAAETFRRLYWDTAASWSDPVINMLRATVGLDRVLFGTDFPYLRRDLAIAGAGELRRTPAIDEAEYKAVLGGNALQLFPRLAMRQR